MLGLEMSAFADPFLRGEFTCRSHEDHNHRSNRKTSSFAIGKDPKCRIYDKAKELRDNPDPLKYEAMVELRWGGTHPKVAPRVEWQIRRDTIKSFGVDSVEDWLERRQGVIDYLFEWLRFVDTGGRPFKAKNAERYPTLPVWLQACEGFAGWASSDVKQVVRNTKSGGQAPPAKLREIAGGCLLASHAQTATEWRGFGEFLEYSIRELSAWWLKFKDDEIGKRWLRKRRELQVKKPPNSNRRLGVRPKIVPFNTWLNELIDKREAIETAGGQLPFDFPWDGFDLSQLHKIVGD
ncbi:MAG: hypothetical protein K8T25_01335 [Planctomycetia bacterium]|nr:hypothetical protein [Planctomycetia bacterium]